MKRIFYFLALSIVAGALAPQVATAQSPTKTIVLVRHAEKADTTGMSDTAKGDPDLSAEGRERAERLMKFAKRYKPHEIFSTNYKRTRQTVEPIAKQRGKEIQTYDPAKAAEFVQQILASNTDHYLIVGHSNSIPPLANLLAKKELFRNLLETEYGAIWVIRLKNGILQKVEVFPY